MQTLNEQSHASLECVFFFFFVYLGTPANVKRRRYYPPDIKRILYAMCLERSAPGILQEGVTKSVARDMGVSLRVVQRVWRDGKTGGVSAFNSNKKKIVALKNFHLTQMSSKMCHLGSVILFVT
jgi:transposase-like protein